MTLRKLGQTQTSLGVLVLLFTGLLFAGTSFVFWIVGNLIYSLASIHAGTLFSSEESKRWARICSRWPVDLCGKQCRRRGYCLRP